MLVIQPRSVRHVCAAAAAAATIIGDNKLVHDNLITLHCNVTRGLPVGWDGREDAEAIRPC